MRPKLIVKFGGTSLATIQSWQAVGRILEERRERQPLVVVSAVGSVPGRAKVTDLLISLCESGEGLPGLKEIHQEIIKGLALPKDILKGCWAQLEDALKQKEHSPTRRDEILGWGERLSARMMAAFLNKAGWDARAAEPTEMQFITDTNYHNASVLETQLDDIAKAVFKSKESVVFPGFVGVTTDGHWTTLGRGGSDYTASVFGAALKREVEIFTDVSGVAICNPNYLPDSLRQLGHPRTIQELSHEEAYQMAAFGSKVLFQKCLDSAQMASRKGRHLQLWVKNTFSPDSGSTLLAGHRELKGLPKGITALEGVQLLTVYLDRSQDDLSLAAQISELTQQSKLRVLMSSNSTGRASFVFDRLTPELEELEKQLSQAHLSRDQVLIKVVGDAIGENHSAISQIHHALERVTVRDQHPAVHKSPQLLTDSTFEMVAYKRNYRSVILELYRQLFMGQEVHVGLLGLGNVGAGVIEYSQQLYSPEKSGVQLHFPLAAVRDAAKSRSLTTSLGQAHGHEPSPIQMPQMVQDPQAVIDDPRVEVVAELMGGLEPARSLILSALRSGKSVVTANKAVIAHFGPELFEAAGRWGGSLAFEASVCGEIPVLDVLEKLPSATDVHGICAIANGTSNFIVTLMQEGQDYAEALQQAQKLGFAEADPTLDVSGADAAQKLAILSSLVFHRWVEWSEIPLSGIETLRGSDFRAAKKIGHQIRPLAFAQRLQRGFELWVSPALLPFEHPLAAVNRETNAVALSLSGRSEPLTLVGKGAGSIPTARSVVRDLAQLARGIRRPEGRSGLYDRKFDPFPGLVDSSQQNHRWWLRFTVLDEPGVFAQVTKALGSAGLSICEASQELEATSQASIYLTTRMASRRQLDKALRSLQGESWLAQHVAFPMLT